MPDTTAIPPDALRRVNVVGTSGVGKSTFARRLAILLGTRHIEMDAVFWRPGWAQPSDEAFFARLAAELARERWVLDGNYTRSIPVKWAQVDTVIWLDYSLPRTLIQAARRAIYRSLTRQELWPGTGNRESVARLFSRDSILLWTLKTYRRHVRSYEACITDPRYAHIRFMRFRTPREADAFLGSLPAQPAHE